MLKSLLYKVAGRKAYNFIKKRLQHRCFPINVGKFLKNLFSRISAYACFWKDFRKWLITTFFRESRFQNHPDLVILQKYQSLSNQNILYIQPLRFILNSGFLCSSLTVTIEKQTLVVPGLLVLILRGSYKISFYLNENKG